MQSREQFHSQIQSQADAIEAELKRHGHWQTREPSAEELRFKQPYAADTMPFPQWLQFIFLPRVRELLKSGKSFPRGSTIGGHAERALRGQPGAHRLVELLDGFDRLIAPGVDDFLSPGPTASRGGKLVTVAVVWTLIMLVIGASFAALLPQFMPTFRHEIISFTASQPKSRAYDLLVFTYSRYGSIGRLGHVELLIQLSRGAGLVPGGVMTIDPKTLAYHYTQADGQIARGALTPEAIVGWMMRNGVESADEPARQLLLDEAEDVVQIAHAADAPAALEAMLHGSAARKLNFELSPPHPAATERPGHAPLWLRAGAPALLWLLGLAAIAVLGMGQTTRRDPSNPVAAVST